MGKWKTLKCGNRSTETEVQKSKYEVRRKASSPRIFTNGSNSYETTPETLANSHRSLGMRPQQDYIYTHCVMLNDCVSGPWSPMYQCSAFTLLGDSYPLVQGTVVSQ